MSGMPPPADPSRTSIFSAVDLTEEREEAEVAAEMERKARESAENIRRMLDAHGGSVASQLVDEEKQKEKRAEAEAQYLRDSEKLRRKMYNDERFKLDPDGRFFTAWEILLTVLCAIIAVRCPYELSLIHI